MEFLHYLSRSHQLFTYPTFQPPPLLAFSCSGSGAHLLSMPHFIVSPPVQEHIAPAEIQPVLQHFSYLSPSLNRRTQHTSVDKIWPCVTQPPFFCPLQASENIWFFPPKHWSFSHTQSKRTVSAACGSAQLTATPALFSPYFGVRCMTF